MVQVEIEDITKKDQAKFESDKENKIDKEIGSLRLGQKNEEDALELKISIHLWRKSKNCCMTERIKRNEQDSADCG